MASLTYTTATYASSLASTHQKSLFQTLPFSFPILQFSLKTPNPAVTTLSTTFPTLSPLKSYTSLSDLSPTSASSASTIATSSSTARKSLKSRLRDGETLYGIFLLSFSPTLAEIVGLSGYDFVVIDMEHGPGGITEALHCLRALGATHTPAILRLPESCPTWAKKALDLGPQGIMFPMIDSPKSARKAVSYCRFPPAGIRGAAHPVVRASNYGIDEGYLSNCEDELLIMCQVESEEGTKKAEEIAAVEGVDCIQMGPLDLSASLGYLWDPGHKKVREMMRVVEKAVLGSKPGSGGGAYLAGFSMPHDGPEELRTRGYHMVVGAVDVGMFRAAAVEDVRRFKMGCGVESDSGDEREHGDDDDEKYWSE